MNTRLLIGMITIVCAVVMGVLTALSIKSAGEIDPLSVISMFVVLLFLLAGIGAIRSEK